MNYIQITVELKRLWKECPKCVKLAEDLQTPDGQDTKYSKIAIVGFSYHDKTENWDINHFEMVETYMKECSRAGHDTKMKEYLALCHGALLGLYSSGAIDDNMYSYGMTVLPGYAFGKGAERP